LDLVYLNGSYLPPEEALVPVTDRGFAYGDGVFTTIKVLGSNPLFLDRHLARLGRDADAINLPAPLDEVESAIWGLVGKLGLGDGVLKATLTRGTGGRGPSPKNAAGPPTVVVSASSLPAPRPPLAAISVPDERGSLASHKTLNYLPNVLTLAQAEAAGCEEAIFSRDGLLLEGTVSNLIGAVGNRLITPPLSEGVLGGVAREVLLEGGVATEGPLPLETDGPLYCVNAVRGVEPVAALDGRTLRRKPETEDLIKKALGG
jgi:branched-chain amino acid aminotransferase